MAPNLGQNDTRRFTEPNDRSIDFQIDVLETLNNKHKSKNKICSVAMFALCTLPCLTISHEMNNLHETQNLSNFRKKRDMTNHVHRHQDYLRAYHAATKLWVLTFVIIMYNDPVIYLGFLTWTSVPASVCQR